MVKVSLSGNTMYLRFICDEGMWCHSIRIELVYSDNNFRRIAQWVLAVRQVDRCRAPGKGHNTFIKP